MTRYEAAINIFCALAPGANNSLKELAKSSADLACLIELETVEAFRDVNKRKLEEQIKELRKDPTSAVSQLMEMAEAEKLK